MNMLQFVCLMLGICVVGNLFMTYALLQQLRDVYTRMGWRQF